MVRVIMHASIFCVGIAGALNAQVSPELQTVDALIVDANQQILEMERALEDAEAALSAWETSLSRASANGTQTVRLQASGPSALDQIATDVAEHPGVAFAHGLCRDDLEAFGNTSFRQSALNRLPNALACARELSPRVRIDLPFECASLFWVEGARGGLKLSGHVQHPEDLEALKARFGSDPVSEVTARPFPVCSALEALELPLTSQNKPSIRMLEGKPQIAFNESLAFELVTPDFYAFVYLAYLQADGKVINLLPRRGLIREQHAPRTVLRFGDGLEGRQTYTASAPAGTEAIIGIASRSPIEFLEDLEQGAAGQYVAADNFALGVDQSTFLELLNRSIEVEFQAGAGQREISAEVLHLTVVPG